MRILSLKTSFHENYGILKDGRAEMQVTGWSENVYAVSSSHSLVWLENIVF